MLFHEHGCDRNWTGGFGGAFLYAAAIADCYILGVLVEVLSGAMQSWI